MPSLIGQPEKATPAASLPFSQVLTILHREDELALRVNKEVTLQLTTTDHSHEESGWGFALRSRPTKPIRRSHTHCNGLNTDVVSVVPVLAFIVRSIEIALSGNACISCDWPK